ncbi:AsmA-like C-terminal region-containing protein [Daeguia caeni]|uniref:AsmA-like C-terminal region-containing protein n=1 Tax=Daeguia caeni TaxID=439612 RepID=A0ABV9H599_9HYPH
MHWPRLARIVIAFAIFCAAGAATLLAIAPFIVSTDAIRIRVAQEISAWTGYSVSLQEAPRLKVFPVLSASLKGVTLSKMSVHGELPFMRADQIEVELSPFDALMGHISFTETHIIRPRFNLNGPVVSFNELLDALANSNGRLGTAIRAQRELIVNGDGNQSAAGQAAERVSQPFGRVVVRDGTIFFGASEDKDAGEKDAADRNEEITGINLTLDWPLTTSAATLKGKAVWRGEETQIDITAAQALQLLAGGMSDLTANLNSSLLSLTFQGKGNISKDQIFEGNVSARTSSLNTALRWLNLPAIMGNHEFGNVNLASNINATRRRIKFADVNMTADGSQAKGVLELMLENAQPALTGTLAFERLDLRKLFSVFVPLPEDRALSPNERGEAMQDEIDMSVIDRAEVDLRLSAQNASAGPISLTDLAATVQIRGGRAIFDIGDAKAFTGTLQTNVQIVRDLKSANGELRFTASDIDSAAFLRALGVKQPFISGKGNISLFMKGPVHRWSTLLTNAVGNVRVELRNGQMQGFNLQDFLARAQSERFFALTRKDNVSLAFTRLDLKANLVDGVATLESARLETPEATLNLAGIVPFVDRSLALSGEVIFPSPRQAESQDAPGQPDNMAAPAMPAPVKPSLNFFVGGSWDRPFISPATIGNEP